MKSKEEYHVLLSKFEEAAVEYEDLLSFTEELIEASRFLIADRSQLKKELSFYSLHLNWENGICQKDKGSRARAILS